MLSRKSVLGCENIFGVLAYHFLSKVLKLFLASSNYLQAALEASLMFLNSYQVATDYSFMYLLSHQSKEYSSTTAYFCGKPQRKLGRSSHSFCGSSSRTRPREEIYFQDKLSYTSDQYTSPGIFGAESGENPSTLYTYWKTMIFASDKEQLVGRAEKAQH